jgi:H+-transporting ATPase
MTMDDQQAVGSRQQPPDPKSPGSTPVGLTDAEVTPRRAQFGYNELPEKHENLVLKLAGYFWGPIPWMIEAAVVLSAIVGHWLDFGIILLLLAANAIVGFWEEYQAGNAIAALKAKLALMARTKRNGAWTSIPARELVPDDVVRLRLGEIVPADAKLLEGDSIEIDQSALTGESLPVTRKTNESVYAGSIVRQGEIDAQVTGTGPRTYFGMTAKFVEEAHTVSHFQQAVLRIGNYLIVIAVALVSLILIVALSRGDSPLETIQFALVLTVAAIPVAMPTVLSVTMAVGARSLARREAIVSRLVAIEELAGMNLLCSDKTGTLTKNQLTLGKPFCIGGNSAQSVIANAALASRAEDQDPIDLAVLGGVGDGAAIVDDRVLHFRPFDPVSKRTEATVAGRNGAEFQVAKGAPQAILSLLESSADVASQVEQAVGDFAARGYRSLGVARADKGAPWRYLGVLPLFDPPREDSRETITAARQMGIDVKMVTGDQVAIGKEVAGQVGLGTNILDAALFADSKQLDGRALADTIERADGFAQVFPEHKYKIVEVLQQEGYIVGMTGDGVNDAPALKKADAGIAVSGATDAARAAADIVLLTPGLSVIIDAIKESRKIFERMNSYATYRIAETIRVLLFMTLAILVFNFYPVTAVMIVLLALLNDGAILSIAYDRVRYSDQPQAWNMRHVLGLATALGIAGVLASFGMFYLCERVLEISPDAKTKEDMIKTLMYLKLSVAGHLTIFVTRTRGPFWSIRPAAVLLAAVVGTQAVATLIAVYGVFDLMVPIGWGWALFVWVYALGWFLFNDCLKLLVNRFLGDAEPTSTQRPSAGTTEAVGAA